MVAYLIANGLQNIWSRIYLPSPNTTQWFGSTSHVGSNDVSLFGNLEVVMRPAFASYAPLWLQRFRPRSVRRCHFRGFVWTVPLLQTERKWSTPLAKQLFEAISV